MEDNVCRFLSGKNAVNLVPQYFVYERHSSSFGTQKHSVYTLHLVCEGSGSLHCNGHCFALNAGDVFAAYPAQPYRIEGESLRCYYITFFGTAVTDTLSKANITPETPVRQGFSPLLRFWEKALSECHPENFFFIAAGVLMYTLACLIPQSTQTVPVTTSIVAEILRYADAHYSDPKLTLALICMQNFYNPGYVSSLFKKEVGVPFSKYLSALRINRARGYMDNGARSVKEAAYFSGFTDPFYFSKVFKAEVGLTPTEYLRQVQGKAKQAGRETAK